RFGGDVIVERRLTEAQRHHVRGSERDAVGAETGARGGEDRGGRGRRGGHQRVDLGGGDARHVTRDRGEHGGALGGCARLRGGDGGRVALVLRFAHDRRAESLGD